MIFEYARAYPASFFVQVGSNDGLQLDPLREEIRFWKWPGIMIEPVPYIFERLRLNYGDRPGISLENVAIADTDGTRDFYFLPEAPDDAGLPAWYGALGSFRKDVVLSHRNHIPDIDDRLATIQVPCLTFDALCRKHDVAGIDVLHIDTEGYDYEIIKLADLARWRPKVLMFEHLHLDPGSYAECLRHVRSHGYEDVSNPMDTLCLRADVAPGHRRLERLWDELRGRA